MESTEYVEWMALGLQLIADYLAPALIALALLLVKRLADAVGVELEDRHIERARARLTENTAGMLENIITEAKRRETSEEAILSVGRDALVDYWTTTLPDTIADLAKGDAGALTNRAEAEVAASLAAWNARQPKTISGRGGSK